MSEQVDMVKIIAEPNEPDGLFAVCNNTNMVDNNSRNDETTPEGKI